MRLQKIWPYLLFVGAGLAVNARQKLLLSGGIIFATQLIQFAFLVYCPASHPYRLAKPDGKKMTGA